MNTILQEKLVEIIELGQGGVLQAVEVLKEQAPEIVRQFMVFETFISSFGVFCGTIFLAIAFSQLFHLKKMKWNLDKTREFVSSLILALSGGIGIAVIMNNGYTLTKILIAPNLYIIQNLLQVLK